MAKPPSLHHLAEDFARTVQDLLNGTVSNGVRLSVSGPRDRPVTVGYKLTRQDPFTGEPLALTIDGKKPSAWLDLQFRCSLNEAGFLTVTSSFYAIYADRGGEQCLCHYDYERDKLIYPEAHLQIHAESKAGKAIMAEAGRGAEGLDKLHFPVGGRRYRPCLEDVLEFLIVEKLARGRRNWRARIKEGRDRFQEIQLRAAIRRMPDVAREVIREIDGEFSP